MFLGSQEHYRTKTIPTGYLACSLGAIVCHMNNSKINKTNGLGRKPEVAGATTNVTQTPLDVTGPTSDQGGNKVAALRQRDIASDLVLYLQ